MERIQGCLRICIALFRSKCDLFLCIYICSMIPVIISSVFIQTELIFTMSLSITVEHFGTAVCMVMSLKNNINIICIKHRSKLCTKYHTICIRMIKARSVNVLMDRYDSPFRIRISLNSFFNCLLMFCYIVVVSI